jgi:phosphatidylglycerol---prolipoprotein diacylglyceryl transferase
MYPVLFTIGSFEVHTFGFVLVVAFVAAFFYGRARAHRFGLTKDQVSDAFFWTLVAGVLGARIGFIVQELPHYLANPSELLSLQFQGLTSFGGILGGMLALWFSARRAGVPTRNVYDLAAAPMLLGHAIGRVGCLLNGCCYGRACELPWGVPVQHMDGLFHPAQIYDSLMVLGGLAFLLAAERRGLKPGQSVALALIVYSLSRFIYEFWRAGTVAEVEAYLAPISRAFP